jgi:hypothetical protein
MITKIKQEPPRKTKTQVILEALPYIDDAITRGWQWADIYTALRDDGIDVASVNSLKVLVGRARKRAKKLGLSQQTTHVSSRSISPVPGARPERSFGGVQHAKIIK